MRNTKILFQSDYEKESESLNCRERWLLKKPTFLKTAKIWGIENVNTNREIRL
jgi:hypothetical protein